MTTTTISSLRAGIRGIRLGTSQRIAVLTGAVATVAVLLFVVVVEPLPAAATALSLPWPRWVAALALAEVAVVYVQWRRDSQGFSITALVLAAGLFLAAPSHLVTALVVGTALSMVLVRRQRGLKLAFNVAQYALGGCVTVLTFAALSGVVGNLAWVAALGAIVASTLTAALCIFAVMTIAEGRADVRPLLGMLSLSLPFTIGSAAVGVIVARTAVSDPSALFLLGVPTFLIIAAYRAYTRAREQQENLKLLHEVTSLLHGGDVDAALGDFLTSTRTAFRAGMAELVLVNSAGTGGLTVSRSQDGADPLVMAPVADDAEQHRLLRLATAQGSLATRTGAGRGGPLDDYATERGFKDAMVAALRTEDRVHGLLLVAGRLGD